MTDEPYLLITRCLYCQKVVRTQPWDIPGQELPGYHKDCITKDANRMNANAKARLEK